MSNCPRAATCDIDLRPDACILNPHRKVIVIQILLSKLRPATIGRLQRRNVRIVRRLSGEKVDTGRAAYGNSTVMLVVGYALFSNQVLDLRHYRHGIKVQVLVIGHDYNYVGAL